MCSWWPRSKQSDPRGPGQARGRRGAQGGGSPGRATRHHPHRRVQDAGARDARADADPRDGGAVAHGARREEEAAIESAEALPKEKASKERAPRVAPFLVQKARAFDEALAAAQPRVLGNTDSEAVHDLRVALRRLRTLLKLARPIFGAFHTDAVRRAFVDLQASTGDLRDEEALADTLKSLKLDHASLTPRGAHGRLARDKRLRGGLVRRLRQGELDRARALLQALLTLPVHPDRDAALHKFGRRMVQKAQQGVESRRDTPQGRRRRAPRSAHRLQEAPVRDRDLHGGAPGGRRRDGGAGRTLPEASRGPPRSRRRQGRHRARPRTRALPRGSSSSTRSTRRGDAS